MNYNDQILENKEFNFFKQLMYNLALSVCILLIGVLALVYCFGFQLFEVLSDSQAPSFYKTDMIIVKAQDEYEVGDILQFKNGATNVAHRCIGIYEVNKVKYFVCHGDNVESANPANGKKTVPWEQDAAFIKGILDEYGTLENLPLANNESPRDIQIVKEEQIIGSVVNHISNIGTLIKFIKEHYLLFITIVAGVWCVSTVAQNEIEIKKSRRLV